MRAYYIVCPPLLDESLLLCTCVVVVRGCPPAVKADVNEVKEGQQETEMRDERQKSISERESGSGDDGRPPRLTKREMEGCRWWWW